MKVLKRMLVALVGLAAFMLPATAYARSSNSPFLDDEVVFGGSYNLSADSVLDGSLLVFGGAAKLEEGSLVDGDVVMFGGSLTVNGEVDGSLVAFGSVVSLGENAIISGDLVSPGSTLYRESSAQVDGQIITETGPLPIDIPNLPSIDINTPSDDNPSPRFPVRVDFTPITDGFWFLFRTFAFSALALLVAIFLPNQTRRTAGAVMAQPVAAGGFGLLTAIVLPPILVILAITLILSPVSLLGFIILAVAIIFGWIAIGLEIGRRLADAFQRSWSTEVQAGLGTFTLTLVVGAIGWIPCFGWLAWLIVGALGLGAVILTRFGTQEYLGTRPATVMAVESVEPPEPGDPLQ